MDGWVDGWMDGWMDGWAKITTDGCGDDVMTALFHTD